MIDTSYKYILTALYSADQTRPTPTEVILQLKQATENATLRLSTSEESAVYETLAMLLSRARKEKEVAEMEKEIALKEVQSRDERIRSQDEEIITLRTRLRLYEIYGRSKEDVQMKLAFASEKCSALENQSREKDQEISSLREKLEDMKTEGGKILQHIQTRKIQIRGLQGEIRNLRLVVEEMEEQREINEPLLRCGIAIRTRYLIQAWEAVHGRLMDNDFSQLISIGHRAAHAADGQADEALLISGAIDHEFWTPRFEGIIRYRAWQIQVSSASHSESTELRG